ncbi:cytochrome c [Poseidonocella sp. HB161398]|uniref:c-type cytochrome n=1 Tax=Poseidonocella sp. HB161398 TaxID=2320855 RepID=UPI001107AFFA|nr:cytochrome c [Poseidonocella sp. HB161398]
MANFKAFAGGVAALVLIAAAGAGIWAWRTADTWRNAVADDAVALADIGAADPEAVARGEYIMRAADCAACHTREQGDFAGGYEIATPFGTLVSSNITPDRETGIGAMTERDFFDAVRHGQGQKGFLYPAMPYTAYARISDQDMHDLWAYMSTVAPVRNSVDENGGMAFPYSIRLAMLGWNMLFFDGSGFEPAPGNAQLARGQYMVDGPGHCSACHSPRNALGAEIGSAYLQGAVVDGWLAPEITSNRHQGLGDVSAADVAEYLGTATDGKAMASGPMAEAVEHSLQYLTEDDRLAMAAWLKSVPGSDVARPEQVDPASPEMHGAALQYEVSCSACHGTRGEGMGDLVPAFDGNHALLSENPASLVRVMLEGARAGHSGAKPTGAGMPSFAWKYDDAQIAGLLTYIRNAWSNAGMPVDPAQVADMRGALAARDKAASGF